MRLASSIKQMDNGKNWLRFQLYTHFKSSCDHNLLNQYKDFTIYRVSQNNCALFVCYCGGAVDSIISVFTQLHRSAFNLKFETLFESIWHVVAHLWQRKGTTRGCFKYSTSIVLQQSQSIVSYLLEIGETNLSQLGLLFHFTEKNLIRTFHYQKCSVQRSHSFAGGCYISFLTFCFCYIAVGLATSYKNERRQIEKRKEERRKGRPVTLVHPIAATFKFSFLPYNMVYGEQKNLNVALIGWARVTSLLLSFFFFFLFSIFHSSDGRLVASAHSYEMNRTQDNSIRLPLPSVSKLLQEIPW